MTHSKRQADIQVFIDSLSIVERHRVMRALNASSQDDLEWVEHNVAALDLIREAAHTSFIHIIPDNVPMIIQYDTKHREMYRIIFSTGTAGRKD
jgi:hypothetical protein